MSDTTAAINDRILDLAELLDGMQEQLVLLEKQADAAKTPLDAAKSAQDAAVAALHAAVEGLNAPKLDGFRAEIDTTKRHLQAALDEYSQQIDSLLTQYATMEAATRSLQEQFSSALAEEDAKRVEFSRKSEGDTAAITVNVDTLRAKVEEIQQKFDRRCTEIASAPAVKPEDFAAAITELRGELSAKFEAAKQEVVTSPGLNPRGKYDEKQQYAKMDLVESYGSSFIALTDGKKERPRKGKPNIGWMVCAAGAGGVGGSADAVLYTAQTLTTEQKEQARSNIGVAGGTGDLVASNNLSDVSSTATAFANIKQAATTSATGVVELATDGETGAGKVVQGNDSRLSDSRTPTAHVHSGDALTPASLAAVGAVTGSNLSGTNTGDQTSVTGNAGTATALQNARTINGVSFNGTANITVTAAGSTLSDTVPVGKGGTGLTAVGSALQVLRTNAGATALEFATLSGGGNAQTADPLSQFAATTSSQLAGVISDETGSGALVFATSPTLVTPALGTPSALVLTNATGLPTAGLVDDAVTLAKMAAGTAGNLITYDASGNPAAVATGTATHVLTSNGAGAAPTFQAAAAGSGTKTYAVFTALDGQPPATDFATFDTANSIALLSFSATATNRTIFVGKLPEAAVVSSGLKVYLHWRSGGATSGNSIWNIEFEKSTGHDLDADGWDTVTSNTAAASATDGTMAATEVTCTTIDSIVAGDVFRLRVSRLGADGSDTLTVPAQLVLVEVRSAA